MLSLVYDCPQCEVSLFVSLFNVDPVMTVSADSSDVSFNNCGFSSVDNGTCVIQVNMSAA